MGAGGRMSVPPSERKPESATTCIPYLPQPLSFVAWAVYWAVQGSVMTGVWVIAHECGHHAFSDYQWVDDTVGLILHSALLVPYFSWKYSHRRHHSNTGSLERDEVFVPKKRSSIRWWAKYLNNPLGRFFSVTIQLTLGWPLYLMFNVAGRPYDGFACHYNPYGPSTTTANGCKSTYPMSVSSLSPTGCTHCRTMIRRSGTGYGVRWQPLTVITDTEQGLPYITDTHVAHHLFSTMPHYHAMEATRQSSRYGRVYSFDGTPVYRAIFREAKCIFVEPDEGEQSSKGVFWFRNKF
ncbi:Omega-6 fatty acid desaturase, endoplasmic reticulum isozyme 1 [Hibiscus syriacus]|uniref:Omega-6 fatty acid desaturase, endoplasmic reticulum isozyme 1 n=1 Tax=Hibiscus syriacus TaxID=106335 RepID=A0A6A3C7A7_HIBSY|nr:Omega-6 fatty acid desaturase, endoplasmic reticulum isozyme 1 [Hibiscus syriacus]